MADVTAEELREYEGTGPDGTFDLTVAEKIGSALEVMEAVKSPKVDNGGKPLARTDTAETHRRFENETVEAARDVEDATTSPNPSPMNPAFP